MTKMPDSRKTKLRVLDIAAEAMFGGYLAPGSVRSLSPGALVEELDLPVSRDTLYRAWPDRGALAAAFLGHAAFKSEGLVEPFLTLTMIIDANQAIGITASDKDRQNARSRVLGEAGRTLMTSLPHQVLVGLSLAISALRDNDLRAEAASRLAQAANAHVSTLAPAFKGIDALTHYELQSDHTDGGYEPVARAMLGQAQGFAVQTYDPIPPAAEVQAFAAIANTFSEPQ